MLEKNLKIINEKIRAAALAYAKKHNLDSNPITLVGVSKYQTLDDIKALYNAGQHIFGENRVQDFRLKADSLKSLHIQWHFIGSLQTNKINALLALNPELIHSIDSLELASALDKRCERISRIQRVLLQVNATNEKTKHGFNLQYAKEAYMKILEDMPNLCLEGIMSIGANSEDIGLINEGFAKTKELFDSLPKAKILSMGMSGDFELAINNGANMLRIGSALFAK